jgi:O-antigen ligase
MIFLYFLIFAMPFYQHHIIDAGSGTFTVVKAVGALGLVGAGMYVIQRGIPDYLESLQAKLFFAMVGLAFVSFLRHGRPPSLEIGSPFQIYISMVVFFLIIVSLVDTPKKIRYSLLFAAFAAAAASFYILREFAQYHSLYGDNFRPSAKVIGDANYFSMAGMLAVPISYFWFTAERDPIYRWFILATLLVTSAGIAVSGSRGGLLALFTFILFVAFRSRYRLRNMLIISLILIPPMLMVPRNPVVRIFHPDEADRLGTQSRLQTWKAGLRMIADRPLMGIGLGEFKPTIAMYAQNPRLAKIAHNTYLEIAAELGVPCLLLYLWLLHATYRSLKRTGEVAQRLHSELFYNIALGMQGGLIGFLVSSFFLSAEYVKFFWFYVFFSVALMRVTRKWAAHQISTQARLTHG